MPPEPSSLTPISQIDPTQAQYDDLNDVTKAYLQFSSTALVFMSICLGYTIWQLKVAIMIAYRNKRWINYAVLFEASLSFMSIFCSVLNPLTEHIDCEMRFWLSIVTVNLAGCCIQSILLYKAYICYEHSKWILVAGSIINLGYIALILIYATLGKVPTYKDLVGNCLLQNLEWPALAKLGLDLGSNVFLSIAFLLVITRHYRVFGNSLHKTLISNGIIFSVGVIVSNIITAILVSTKVMGGLSADLYAFEWVVTTYLLLRQFKMNKPKKEQVEPEEDYESGEDNVSIDMNTVNANSVGYKNITGENSVDQKNIEREKQQYILETQAERVIKVGPNSTSASNEDKFPKASA